jgi:hypothetical protein
LCTARPVSQPIDWRFDLQHQFVQPQFCCLPPQLGAFLLQLFQP